MTQPFLTSIDIMKWTKDTLAHQPDDATIQRLIATIKRDINPSHIAIAVPLNPSSEYPEGQKPSPRTAEGFTQFLCDTIHDVGMNVIFRGTLCELEGIYDFEKAVGAKRVNPDRLIAKVTAAIHVNPGWFRDGDEWAPLPERTENIFQDSTAFLANLPQGYADFFIDLMDRADAAFGGMNKQVGTSLTANNYTEVASGWIPRSLFDHAGVVAIDHYARTPDALYNDIKAIHERLGLPVFLEEWGNYWDDAPLKPFLDVLGRLADEGILTGFNYWGAWPGAQEGLLNDDLTINDRGREVAAFFASRQRRKTFTGMIPRTRTSVKRMKKGNLRVTLDIQDANVFDASRLLSEIGKPVSITIERKE